MAFPPQGSSSRGKAKAEAELGVAGGPPGGRVRHARVSAAQVGVVRHRHRLEVRHGGVGERPRDGAGQQVHVQEHEVDARRVSVPLPRRDRACNPPPPSDSGETLSPSLPRTTSCLFGFPWVFHVRLRIDMLAADVRAYPPPDYIAALHSDAAACSRTREAIVVQVKVPHARRHVRRQLSAQLVALQHQHCMRMPPQPRSAHRYVCLRGLEYVK